MIIALFLFVVIVGLAGSFIAGIFFECLIEINNDEEEIFNDEDDIFDDDTEE